MQGWYLHLERQYSQVVPLFHSELPDWIYQLPQVQETWSAESQTLEGYTDLVHSVAFLSNGRLIASSSFNKTFWDPVAGALQEILSTNDSVTELEFLQDSSYLCTNLGPFKVQSSCGNPISNSLNMVPRISLQCAWIASNGKQVLWLPPEARPSC
ncbi:uncharacterized protein An08g08160 [Aspergillus niger]|uniref:Contig An08c0220, genomic contig n=2 Tax=Aspergillus niger TaxID=5061 RepID=A2QS35_ASPNC|nr:uncharacterized protein An08g08160 [Aspergillus niger]CAK40019.1 unnamed protein product [Aspergillus niger]